MSSPSLVSAEQGRPLGSAGIERGALRGCSDGNDGCGYGGHGATRIDPGGNIIP